MGRHVPGKSLYQDPCWPWKAVHHGCVSNGTTRLEQRDQLSRADQGKVISRPGKLGP